MSANRCRSAHQRHWNKTRPIASPVVTHITMRQPIKSLCKRCHFIYTRKFIVTSCSYRNSFRPNLNLLASQSEVAHGKESRPCLLPSLFHPDHLLSSFRGKDPAICYDLLWYQITNIADDSLLVPVVHSSPLAVTLSLLTLTLNSRLIERYHIVIVFLYGVQKKKKKGH